jgi:hypothetical protein
MAAWDDFVAASSERLERRAGEMVCIFKIVAKVGINSKNMFKLLGGVFLMCTLFGCTRSCSGEKGEKERLATTTNNTDTESGMDATANSGEATSQSSNTGGIKLDIAVSTVGVKLLLTAPEGEDKGNEGHENKWECRLDGNEITPCAPDAMIARPEYGDHDLVVIMKRDDDIVGTAKLMFSIPGPAINAEKAAKGRKEPISDSSDSHDPKLTLAIADINFVIGDSVKLGEPLTLKLKFLADNDVGCTPKFNCALSKDNLAQLKECNGFVAKSLTMTFPAELIEKGVQYFSIQASCGNRVGPPLSVYWRGSPDIEKE